MKRRGQKTWTHPRTLGTSRCPALEVGRLEEKQVLKHTEPEAAATAAAKSLQSCPTLYDPRDGSPPGSSIPGILQSRTLEWVAISFSNAWKWKVKVKSLSGVRLFAAPWSVAYQAPPSMGFSRQEYWVGCHCLLPSQKLVYRKKSSHHQRCNRNVSAHWHLPSFFSTPRASSSTKAEEKQVDRF